MTISPDGATIASIESVSNAGDEDSRSAVAPATQSLVLRDRRGRATTVAIPCETGHRCPPGGLTWSRDSKSLAFVTHDPRAKERLLYVLDRVTREPKRVLAFGGNLESPRFLFDNVTLAVLATANAHKEIGATQAGAPIVGEIGQAADEQRIAVVEGEGKVRFVSPADTFVYEYDVAPNGFVATAAKGNGDNNWWIAHLFFYDRATGAARELYAPSSPQQQLADPRVSRDGKAVAFIGGIMSDFGSTGGDVYLVPLDEARSAAAAPAVDLTPAMPASATSLVWGCDDALYATELRGDKNAVERFALPPSGGARAASGTPRAILWSAPVSLGGGNGRLALACDGTAAVVPQSFERAPDIYAGAIGSWTALTHDNEAQQPHLQAKSITWKSDQFTVQGWLLEPARLEAGKKYPLIVSVHGGPAAASGARFVGGRGSTRDLLNAGYFVFYPNPRGSFGQGEAFTLANVKDFGYGDFRDIMRGVDAVEAIAPIDDARLGIMGGSYGGYMTMWAVTQTNRFKAGVAAAGLSNWQSYYGENGIDEWMIPYFGASVYDDPAVYRRSSPIEFVKNAKTPTFIYVGERDIEVPAPQSQEFWHALVALGVPTSLVIYPGEGHRLRDPAHSADAERRTLAWFATYLR